MRIKLFKREDGTVDVVVFKTRREENATTMYQNVERKDVPKSVRQGIVAVNPKMEEVLEGE